MQVAETAMREVVGKNTMDSVLYEGRARNRRQFAEAHAGDSRPLWTGTVSKVTMQNAQPPEQVQAAFDDAVKAGQDSERQKNEGQAYANDVIPKARGGAARLYAGGRRLQAARYRARRGRCQPLPLDRRRIQQGARGNTRAPVPGHDAANHVEHQQGTG